jgi:hypothetical protein
VIVDYIQRHRRLRLLVKKVNRERKRQAKKIDILCNDLVAAQRDFIKRLETVSFKAAFYESIVGTPGLNSLLGLAGKLISEEVPESNVAFFLRHEEGFELHLVESGRPIALEQEDIENCFTAELVADICRSNRICALDDMFAMGLQGSLTALKSVSAFTIPLGRLGSSLGFILIYRPSQNRLTYEELSNLVAIAPGLSHAIESCLTFSQFTE